MINLSKNILIKLKLQLIKKLNFIPRLLRFSIAKNLVILEKPFFLFSSKHPFTVKVSNPNVFLKIKSRDSECINISQLFFLKLLS